MSCSGNKTSAARKRTPFPPIPNLPRGRPHSSTATSASLQSPAPQRRNITPIDLEKIMRTPKLIFLALAAATISGCTRSSHHETSYELFGPEKEIKDMDRFAAAQSAAGARHDGMLYSHHFSGSELNSLGRSKLHLMTADKPATE